MIITHKTVSKHRSYQKGKKIEITEHSNSTSVSLLSKLSCSKEKTKKISNNKMVKHVMKRIIPKESRGVSSSRETLTA